ncbi:MAG TPA: response regulator [Steroidobacteraceae bacterium]|nr:response regulator [Steroidobacteraceae bacterium]
MNTDEHAFIIGVLDDDRRVLESVGNLLESAGYQVRLFDSGEMFLQTEAMNGIDVLICDIRMPGVNGIEVLQQVSTKRPRLPVILITACSDFDSGGIPETSQRVFRKPIDPTALIDAIAAAVKS